MSDQPKRTLGGHFAKGHSGNPAGAGARKPPITSTEDINRTLMKIANRKTQLKTERGIETVNMLERNALALASGSRVGTAPRAFIDSSSQPHWISNVGARRKRRCGGEWDSERL